MFRKEVIGADEFKDALHATTRTISRGQLEIIHAGKGAYASEGRIVLPELAADQVITSSTAAVIAGYADHEAMHHRHTPLDTYSKAIKDKPEEEQKAFGKTLNAVEDMRIEKYGMQEYAGTRENLEAVFISTLEEALAIPTLDEMAKKTGIIPVALTWEVRRRRGMGGTLVEQALDKLAPAIRNVVNEYATDIESGIPDAKRVTDEHGIVTLDGRSSFNWSVATAEGLYRFVMEDRELEVEPLPSEAMAKGGGKKEADGGGEAGGTADATADGKPDDADDAGSDADKSGSPDRSRDDASDGGSTAGGSDLSPSGLDLEIEPSAKKALAELASDAKRSKNYKPFSKNWDRLVTINGVYHLHSGRPFGPDVDPLKLNQFNWFLKGSGSRSSPLTGEVPQEVKSSGKSCYVATAADLKGQTSVLKRKVEREIMSRRRVFYQGGEQHGRLDSRRLVAALGGSENVFRRKVVEDVDLPAVSILVDLSGSMGIGAKIYDAARAVVCLSDALDSLGIPFEVNGWTTTNRCGSPLEAMSHFHRERFRKGEITHKELIDCINADQIAHETSDRTEVFDIVQFKSWADRFKSADVQAALGIMSRLALDNNNDAEAVEFIGNRLMRRHERRKLLLVLSDGEPLYEKGGASAFNGRAYLKSVVSKLERHIEVIGVGVMTEAVLRYYSKNVVFHNMTSFTDSLVKVLRDAILK